MTEPTHLDGNALAGPLSEVFSVDVTAAAARCAGCGAVSVLAETRVYVDAPGVVVRCAGCNGVLLRLVTAPGRTWLDMRGLSYLELPASAAASLSAPASRPLGP